MTAPDTLAAFVVGAGLGVVVLVYNVIYTYRGRPRRWDVSRPEHLKSVLASVAWKRTVLLVLLDGFVAAVLWAGLDNLWSVVA